MIKLLLPDIRSVYNVGTFFRTANAFGIQEIILTGITPTPLDKFARPRKDFIKVALGSESTVSWRHSTSAALEIINHKKNGFKIIVIEQSAESIDYKNINLSLADDAVFVLGNEVDGVSGEILKLADDIVELKMSGTKESLNVSIAGAVIIARILNI